MASLSCHKIWMNGTLLLCTLHLFVIFPVWSQNHVQAGDAASNLELIAEVEKQSFVLGEPVYLSVQLRYTGHTAVTVARVLHPQAGTVGVQITSPENEAVTFSSLFYADVTAPQSTIGQGEAITAVFPIFFGAQGWTFSKPGHYQISATYYDSERKNAKPVQSNSVNLTVSKENGAGTLLMNESIESREAGKLFLWRQGDHLRAGMAHLSQIIQKHPESPISDYANLALGSNLAQPFRDYAAKKIRQPDYAAALAYLQKVRSSQLPRYLKIQKNLDQARCLFGTGDTASAGDLLRDAQALSEGRMEYQPLLEKSLRLQPNFKPSFAP